MSFSLAALYCLVCLGCIVLASTISIESSEELRKSQGVGMFSSLYGTHEYMLFAHRRTSLPMAGSVNGKPELADAIVLGLHMSKNRGDELRRWCQTWRGPISVALFEDSLEKGQNEMKALLNDTCIAEYADIHLTWCVAAPIQVVPETPAMKLLQSIQSRVGNLRRNHRPDGICGKYPFNLQRNVAVEGAELRWISNELENQQQQHTIIRSATGLWHFLVDIDLVLLPATIASHSTLSAHFRFLRMLSNEHLSSVMSNVAPLSDREVEQLHRKRFWTVPAMEYPRGRSTFQHAVQHPGLQRDNNKVPGSASELVHSIRSGQVRPFYISCAQCYGMVNISRFAAISVEFERVISSCRAMKRRTELGKDSSSCTLSGGESCEQEVISKENIALAAEVEKEIVRCVAYNRPPPVTAEWNYPYPFKDGSEPFGFVWKANTPPFSDLLIGRNLDKISMHFQFYYSSGLSYVALPGAYLMNIGTGDDPGQKTEDETNFELQNSVSYWNLKHLELERRMREGTPAFWGGFLQNLEPFLEGPGYNPMWPLEFGGTWVPEYRRDYYYSSDSPDQLVQFSKRSPRMNGFTATHVKSQLATHLNEMWQKLFPYDRLFPLRCVLNDDSGVDTPYGENIRLLLQWCSALGSQIPPRPDATAGSEFGEYPLLLGCPVLKTSPFYGILGTALRIGGRVLAYAEDSLLQHVWQLQFRNASVASHRECAGFGQRSGGVKRGRVIVAPQRCMACIPGPGLDQRLQAALLADLCSSAKLGPLCDLWGPHPNPITESSSSHHMALSFAMTLYMQLEFPHQSDAFGFQIFDFCARGIGGLVVPLPASSSISPLYTQLVACDEVGLV